MSETNGKPNLTGFEGKNENSRAAAIAALRAKFGGQPGPSAGAIGNTSGGAAAPAPAPAPASTPASTAPSSDEIFLSPRVVDRQAFNEFSQSLKEIIEQAAASADTLRRAASDAERTRESLRESIAAQQAKIEQTSKAIASIDGRTEQTRRLIDGANNAVGKIDEVRTRADAVMEERITKLTARIDEVIRSAEARVATLDQSIAPIIREADKRIQILNSNVNGNANANVDAELAPSIAGLKHLCERADQIIGVTGATGASGGLNDLVQRAERAKEDASFAVRQLESVREQSEQAKRILSDAVNASMPLIDEVASVQGHLETTVARAVKLTTSTQESITKQIDEQRTMAEGTISRLTEDSRRLKTELNDTIEQATLARRAAAQAAITGEEAAGHLTKLLDRLEPWHGVLLCRSGQDELPPPLREVLDGVRVELKRDLAGVAAALRAVAERTEQVLDVQGARAAGVSSEVISEAKPEALHESHRIGFDAAA